MFSVSRIQGGISRIIRAIRGTSSGSVLPVSNTSGDQDESVVSPGTSQSSLGAATLNEQTPRQSRDDGGDVVIEMGESESVPGDSSGTEGGRSGENESRVTSGESAPDEDNSGGNVPSGSGRPGDCVSLGVLLGGVVSGGVVLAEHEDAENADEEVAGGNPEESDNLGVAIPSPQVDQGDQSGEGEDIAPAEMSVLRRRRNIRNDHVTVDVEAPVSSPPSNQDTEAEREEKWGPSRYYVNHYLNLMHSFTTCAYKAMSNAENGEGLIDRIVGYLRKGWFWTRFLLSQLRSFFWVKTWLLRLMLTGGYTNFAGFALSVLWFLVKLYEMWILAFGKKKVDRMLEAMEKYEKACPNFQKVKSGSSVRRKLTCVTLLAVTTVLFAFIRDFYNSGVLDIEKTVLQSSQELSEDMFMWSNENRNETIAQLKENYGSNVTIKTIIMAAVKYASDVASFQQTDMLIDLIMMVGLTFHIHVNVLMKDVNEARGTGRFENVEEWNSLQGKRVAAWKKYRDLKEVVPTIHDVFGPLFKLLHLVTFLSVAFFLTLIYYEYPAHTIAIFSINLIKIQIWYFYAGKTAEQNDEICTWLLYWAIYSGEIRVDGIVLNAGMLMIELDKQPIGLGRGSFLIHEVLYYKLLTLVASVFFSIIDEDN